MTNDTDTQLQSIDTAMLRPLVRKALGRERAEVLNWRSERIHASATRASIFRLSGDAHDREEVIPWSLILKVVPFAPDSDDPSSRSYWKREPLAYQSGLLDDLPGGLNAPARFEVVERPGGDFWLWLEDVADDIGPEWPLEHYGVVAQHLGQFNGAYLVGWPIPLEPWLSGGRVYPYIDQADAQIAQLRSALDHPLVRRVWPPPVAECHFRIYDERQAYLAAADRLPRTFCHHDAFKRNLFAVRDADHGYDTVAIDWAFAGTGVIGEELVYLVWATFGFFGIVAEEVPELDEIAFDGYLTGLREAGWAGDRRLPRLGYTASLLLGNLLYLATNISWLTDDAGRKRRERALGRPMEEVAHHWAGFGPYLLQLEEEARGLMQEL